MPHILWPEDGVIHLRDEMEKIPTKDNLIFRAAQSLQQKTGSSLGLQTPLYDFREFSVLMGFEQVWDFEKRWVADP